MLAQYNANRSQKDRVRFCHAPFVSLNFDQFGRASACCFNRKQILGTYPEQSIAEIWNSQAAQDLRSAMAMGDLSLGCQSCERQLKDGNLSGVRARHFDSRTTGCEPANIGFPQIIEFELSNLCNLECVMCNGQFSSSIRRHREKLEPLVSPYDERFANELRTILPHLKWARFLGGEPFLNPLNFKIWDLIHEVNPDIKVVITTNGTILNDSVRKVLTNIKPMLVVSIDSLKKERFEEIRTNASYETAMRNLEFFVRYSRFSHRSLDLAVCPMTLNWEELPDIVNYGIRNNLQVSFNPVTSPSHLSLLSLPPSKQGEIKRHWEKAKIVEAAEVFETPTDWDQYIARRNLENFASLKDQLHHGATP